MSKTRVTAEQVRAVLAEVAERADDIESSGEVGGLHIHTDAAVRDWLAEMRRPDGVVDLLAAVNGDEDCQDLQPVNHGDGAKGIDAVEDGQLIEVVLRGYASNVDRDGKQGSRLTVGAKADGISMSNGIYARDAHVVSVKPARD